MGTKDTAVQLLDAAQELVQARGYNAFSFKHLAAEVGIRTASIHYHFPTKAELGVALMLRYREALHSSLAEIDARRRTNLSRLEGLIELYRDTENRGAICLCGSLASDLETLPAALAAAVKDYLAATQSWVKHTIDAGVRAGEFDPIARSADLAPVLVSSLQGALLISRARGGDSVLGHLRRSLSSSLQAR